MPSFTNLLLIALSLPAIASASENHSYSVTREFQREHPCPSTGLPTGPCPAIGKITSYRSPAADAMRLESPRADYFRGSGQGRVLRSSTDAPQCRLLAAGLPSMS